MTTQLEEDSARSAHRAVPPTNKVGSMKSESTDLLARRSVFDYPLMRLPGVARERARLAMDPLYCVDQSVLLLYDIPTLILVSTSSAAMVDAGAKKVA